MANANIVEATLLLVRHGQSVANAEQRFTHSDDEPLTELGVEQARATARQLAALYQPVALYCSPIARARATAAEIGDVLDLEPIMVEALREQSFGDLRGRPYADYYPLALSLPGLSRWSHRVPGGESLEEVAGRVGPALDEIACRHPARQVVVVSHGGVMAALRAHACGGYHVPPAYTPNAGGYRLVGAPDCGYRGPLDLFEEVLEELRQAASVRRNFDPMP
jgi:probable phosphoglycerate mutase